MPCSGVSAPVYSGTKVAAAASLRSSSALTSAALERSLLSGTQRSSTRVTRTRDQSSAACESCSKKCFGVLPPDTASSALPRCSMPSRRCCATRSASAAASAWQSVKLWVAIFNIGIHSTTR